MTKKPTKTLRIFCASPNDVGAERELVQEVADNLCKPGAPLDKAGVRLEVIRWEENQTPGMGRPEDVLLKQFPPESWDIFVGILWLRFGSRTGANKPESSEPYESGTEEEFYEALKLWQKGGRPHMLMYRCKRLADVDDIDAEQFGRVKDFFKEFKPDGEYPGLYKEYKTTDVFKDAIRDHLFAAVSRLVGEDATAPTVPGSQIISTAQEERERLEAKKGFEEDQKAQQVRKGKELYQDILRNELSSIKMVGAPEVQDVGVELPEVFVHLGISEEYRSDQHQVIDAGREHLEREGDFKPNDMLKRAFTDYNSRLLLIIGDPGSGKTTLLKYYALTCLKADGHQTLKLEEPYFPIFLSLRNLDRSRNLPANLDARISTHKEYLKEGVFENWLDKESTLIMLDGLDEVSELDARRKVCSWICGQHNAFSKAKFIVTSRWTGYRKTDRITIEVKHLRADVRDFTVEQQEEFLSKWFTAAYLSDRLPKEGRTFEWESEQKRKAKEKTATVVSRLKEEGNRSLRQLAGIPMILQIMAIIWKEREYLPHSRTELYDVALNYLLEHRDVHRGLNPILSAKDARTVLAPIALWLQEEMKVDEAEKSLMHAKMEPHLEEIATDTSPNAFCENLRDRAGLLADYGDKNHYYIFRHKSFREYLSGQLLSKKHSEPGCMERLVKHFGGDWWEEPLRFMFAEAEDGKLFDMFMRTFFYSDVSRDLQEKKQTLLYNLVREARRRKPDALIAALESKKMNTNQERYLLECLGIIGSRQAISAIKEFVAIRANIGGHIQDRAEEILRDARRETNEEEVVTSALFEQLPRSFINPIENNAEYILIPAGTILYSMDYKEYPISDMYVARYPVTNRRYRVFVSYLRGQDLAKREQLPIEIFAKQLYAVASGIRGFENVLKNNIENWWKAFRSNYDEDRRFGGEDQPVVGISWFGARAYCLWLNLLQLVQEGISPDERLDKRKSIFRLLDEKEWERAAAGSVEEGGPRTYPWVSEKGEPTEKLCNFENNVGCTTIVGQYVKGATPQGLQDMAGNVFEWQDNPWSIEATSRAIRGGSWADDLGRLRTMFRSVRTPSKCFKSIGFRCALVQKA